MQENKIKPCKISIFGSCVSRDIFNYDTEGLLDLKTYIARQTIVSSVSPPYNIQSEEQIKLTSAFQRRSVLADIRKSAFSLFKNDRSEYLIIDLIDERLGMVNWENTMLTRSSELVNSGLLDGTEKVVRYTSDANGMYYADGKPIIQMFEEFCKRICEIYPQENIIIHVADSKTKYVGKDGKIKNFPDDRIDKTKKINKMYDAMYSLLDKFLPNATRIDIRNKYNAAEEHRWGLAPVHYEESYYKEVYTILMEILNKKYFSKLFKQRDLYSTITKSCQSTALQKYLATITEDNSTFICDFFNIAQKWEADFSLIDSADNLLFFSSEKTEILHNEIIQSIKTVCENNQCVCWIEAFFDTKNCKNSQENERFQKLNWILEEIYAQLISIPGLKRCAVGKIVIADNDIESSVDKFYAVKSEDIKNMVIEEQHKIKWFDVKIDINGSKLTASIDFENTKPKNAQYYFYLLKDRVIIDRQGWMNADEFTWDLTNCGVYCVQGYVRTENNRLHRLSNPISYYNNEAKNEFEQFLSSHEYIDTPYEKNLKFQPSKEPFANFLIVSSKDTKNNLDKFKTLCEGFETVSDLKIGKQNISVLSNGGVKKMSNGDTVLFSGVMRMDDKIIIGANDIPDDANFDTDILSSIGNNSCVKISKDNIIVGSDFFNISHWFYYETDEISVTSNSYHALLLYLKSCGIKLVLDEKKAVVTLATVDVFPLMQTFTRKMDMVGVCQLEVDKEIHITKDGWHKEISEAGKVMSKKAVYHENDYRRQLKLAAKDIVQNVKCAVTDERFEYVHSDLTGGLDSRIIYSALTNISEAKNKVQIVSNHVPGSNDLPIATSINSIYGFEYDDSPLSTVCLSLTETDQTARSFYLGTYFAHNVQAYMNVDYNLLSLNGACGEIVTRPIYANKYFGSMLEHASMADKFAKYVWNDSSANCIAADKNTSEDYIKYVVEELELIPVESLFEKYDKMYLFYRNLYHFNDQLRWQLNYPSWMPIQSKTAFALHHLTFLQFRNIHFELDLIATLNPVLASVRYDSTADNQAYAEIKDSLAIDEQIFKGMTINPVGDMDKWEAAKERKKNNKRNAPYSDPAEVKAITEEYSHSDKYTYDALLNNFCELMHYCPEIKSRIGVDLYFAIQSLKDNAKKIKSFYNKITSLVDQIKIAND